MEDTQYAGSVLQAMVAWCFIRGLSLHHMLELSHNVRDGLCLLMSCRCLSCGFCLCLSLRVMWASGIKHK